MQPKNWLLVPLLVLVLSLGACGLLEDDEAPRAGTPTPELPTPANTPGASTPAALTAASTTPLTLTVWTVPDISPRTEVPGGTLLLEQLTAFDQSHPDLTLFVEEKTVSGQGGMLSYLRTGRGVAPRILPDLMLIPSNQLPTVVAENLVYPLTDLPVEETMFADLYPVALNLVTVNETRYGYPISLFGLHHLAYDGNTITETIPSTWNSFINLENGNFAFPAAGPAGAELALQFYLAHGGTLVDEAGNPQLVAEPLVAALSEFDRAVDNGFILPESGEITTLAESWQAYQNDLAAAVQTDVEQFLAQRNLGVSSSYSLIPGLSEPFAPFAGAWVWVITTPDPARQVLAAELMSWLGSEANVGEWSYQSQRVPARRAAFAAWPADSVYAAFLREQAEAARPFPTQASSAIMSAISSALSAVVSQSSTPQQAAQQAIESLTP